MNKYLWRKNYIACASDQEKMMRGKLAFKTKEMHWLETQDPVIILVSTHSAFHEGLEGDLKMEALVSIIKSHVKGKVTALLSDRAHVQAMSLKYHHNLEKTLEECKRSAQALHSRYRSFFDNCHVSYWHSYICEDPYFVSSLLHIKHLYQSDVIFRELVQQDAKETYTSQRIKDFSNFNLFVEKTIEDLLEQCACLCVLAKKGYRFQFYPGRPYAAIDYANRMFSPAGQQISWINVFLTIEKKRFIFH